MRLLDVVSLAACLHSYIYLAAAQSGGQNPILETNGGDSDCHNACTALVTELGDSAYYSPGSALPGFRETFFAAQQRDVIPACILTPSSASEVAQAIAVIRQHSCIFAVKSGGHSMIAGASNAPGGITIDLRKIDDIEVGEGMETARIGAGNRWKGVYEALEPLNRTVAGGRNSDVGVGGFTMGGGISFLSRRYGWACDNVRNFEVALANGSLAHVNRASSPELFFALRGGGNNFGIVTHFDMEIHPQGPVWGGNSFFFANPSHVAARKTHLNITPEPFSPSLTSIKNVACNLVVKTACALGYCLKDLADFWLAMDKVITSEQADTMGHMFATLTWVSEIDSWMYNNALVYSKPVANPPIFKAFEALPAYRTNKIQKFTKIYEEVAGMNEYGRRHFWGTATFKPSVDLTVAIQDIMVEEVESIRNISRCRPTIVLQPINVDEITIFKKSGGNPLGIEVEDGPLTLFSVVFIWDLPSDDAIMQRVAKNILDRAIAKSKEMGLYHRYMYPNYADSSQDVYAGYGEENREKLRAIQKKYDPEGVFSRLQPGYHKV